MQVVAFALAPLCLAATSCIVAAETGQTDANHGSAARTPLSPVLTLAGQWRVAGIDGRPFDELYGLALAGDDEELWWEPRCALQVRSYRLTGNRVRFGGPAGVAPPHGKPPPIVCLIAPPARLADVMRSLYAAQTVVRTPENGILISGGGHSVLLFSQ